MTPGTYLRKRREAARLSLGQVAEAIAALPWAIRAPSPGEIAQLVARLELAEADRDNLTVPQAELLRNCFRFDVEIYERLLWRLCGADDQPMPQMCRHCACSWCDPCMDHGLPCGWAAADLCTACVRVDEVSAELSAPAAVAMNELVGGAHV
jgi:hypothetical protein